MTKTRKVSIAVGVFLLTVAVGFGQGPFGGFGGFGGLNTPGQLISNQQVRAELKITEEQLKKIDAAILKVINDNLEGDQSKRFKQISLQVRGYQVFSDPKVQAELKFSDEQKDTVKTAITENAEKIKEIFKEGGFGKETFVKMQELNKATQAKVIGVLSDGQKDQFKEMIGEPFQFKFGMGKGKKKNDE